MGTVYSITNSINGKRYIGSAQNVRARFNQHKSALDRGCHHSPHLQSAWEKHGGASFSFDILEDNISDVSLLLREQSWMDKFQSVATGYNIRPNASSQLGFRHSDETKLLMREKRKGRLHSRETKEKISLALVGRVVSQATREKLREKHTGKTMSAAAKAKMSAARTGKKRSASAIAKTSAAKRGVPLTDEHRAKLSAYRKAYYAEKHLADTKVVEPGIQE